MTQKLLIITIALGAVLSVFCKVLYDKVCTLEETNKTLQRALESNLEATKKKEERNLNELERLQKQLNKLHQLNDACLSNDVDDALVVFLQQLQQDSAGTVSFTFTK